MISKVHCTKERFFLITWQLLIICAHQLVELWMISLNERFFQIIYNDKHLSFQYFLNRGRPIFINTCSLRLFATKGVVPNVFANNLISMPPASLSPCYQSSFWLNLGKIGIWWNQNNRSSRSQNLGFSF